MGPLGSILLSSEDCRSSCPKLQCAGQSPDFSNHLIYKSNGNVNGSIISEIVWKDRVYKCGVRIEPRLAPCVVCDKSDCGAKVIVPNVSPEKRQFNQSTECLNLTCPACERPFSVSIFKLEWLEVDEDEFRRGFWGAKRAHRPAQP